MGIIQWEVAENWSLEQIFRRLFKGKLFFKMLYYWIYVEFWSSINGTQEKRQAAEIAEETKLVHLESSIAKGTEEIRKWRPLATGKWTHVS